VTKLVKPATVQSDKIYANEPALHRWWHFVNIHMVKGFSL